MMKKKWIAVIGVMDGRPYEVFTGRAEDAFFLPTYVDKGWVIKSKDAEDFFAFMIFRYEDRDGLRNYN